MKFAICGGLDVPDWVAIISKISAVRVKLCAAAIVKQAQGEEVPFEKLNKLLGDAKLDLNDTKAVIAALHYIVTNVARYDVDVAVVDEELQQLGLPREHSDALSGAIVVGRSEMQRRFRESSLRLPSLDLLQWRLIEDVNGEDAHAIQIECGSLSHEAQQLAPLQLNLTPQMLTLLRAELSQARDQMLALNG